MITSDEILGKEVLDTKGKILGVVTKLHLEPSVKKLVGITVDLGFFKPDLFVGIDFVETFGVEVVFLNKVPADTYLGLKVFTQDGRYLGIVKEIVRSEKKFSEFLVGRPFTFKKKLLVLPRSEIKEIGVSVIVKSSFKHDQSSFVKR